MITPFLIFVLAALYYINFFQFLTSDFSVDGEVIYTASFLIILYAIWFELFTKDDLLVPVYGFFNISRFWGSYKLIENFLMDLVLRNLVLLSRILNIFSLSYLLNKILIHLKFDNWPNKILFSILGGLKVKSKTLPLQ